METPKTDRVEPKGKWVFDDEVTTVFDNMLERSIPQYHVMRQAVASLAVLLTEQNPTPRVVLDLGTSRGEALSTVMDKLGTRDTKYIGCEVSPAMLNAAKARFQKQIHEGNVQIVDFDLREGYPDITSDITLSILTLQFTPIEHRLRIIQDIYDHLKPGGGFILVEKVLGHGDKINKLLVDTYHDLKESNGYTKEDIQRKALSLEGVLVPLTADWNIQALEDTGFRHIDCFWRWMNFVGWVAIKGHGYA